MPELSSLPVGELMQRPPAYSAVKVGGERLYKKARRGEAVEVAARVRSPSIASTCCDSDGERAEFEIECSAGTYIRTLVSDLGDAYCEQLERTAIGAFTLADADPERLLPLAEALSFLPERSLDAAEADRVGHGVALALNGLEGFQRLTHDGCSGGDRRAAPGPAPAGGGVPAMKVTSLPDAEPRERRVAVGTFDGVHLGHREVINEMDTVLTFDPHPLAVVQPSALPKLLQTFPVKRDIIAGLGVDELVMIPFDEEFSQRTHEQFVEDVLIEPARRRRGVGRGELPLRQGRQGRRRATCARRPEFETRVVPLVEVAGETVSSTPDPRAGGGGRGGQGGRDARRPVPARGRGGGRATSAAASWACRPRTSCPTTASPCPGHGVYAAWAHGYPAAVNVGVRPTFETGRGLLVEAYLIDFEGDLYGETLRIGFIERLRGEKRFDSVDELVEQMRRDVEQAANAICAVGCYLSPPQ